MKALIELELGSLVHEWLHSCKKPTSRLRTLIGSRPILFSGKCSKPSFGGHLRHFKSKDAARALLDHHDDRDGLKLGVFDRLEIVELDAKSLGRVEIRLIKFDLELARKKEELSDNCFAVQAQEFCGSTLRDVRGQKLIDGVILMTLLLAEAGMIRCSREGL